MALSGRGRELCPPGFVAVTSIVGVNLLGRFDICHDRAAVVEFHAAGIGIDDEGRIDEIAVILDQPLRRR